MSKPAEPVSFWSLYRLFFIVGVFSFGGGLTAWFHREIVVVRKWMTDDEFFSGYSLAQVIPGVNSTNMAVYIGLQVRGTLGAMIALLGVLSGPFVIVIAVANVYQWLIALPGFQAATAGLAAAAVGMIFRLGWVSSQTAERSISSMLALAATFSAVAIFRLPVVPVLLVIAPLSVAAAWPRKSSDA
jgi:chromate transporter